MIVRDCFRLDTLKTITRMGGSGENIAVLDTYCKGWMAGDAKVVMTTLVRTLYDFKSRGYRITKMQCSNALR